MPERIDAWTHIFPKAYFERLQTMASVAGPLKRWLGLKSLYDLDHRFRLMDGFEGYRQLLTPSMPPIEDLADSQAAVDLMRLMNDGLAELVSRHPDRFPAFAAALSLHDVEAALAEIARAETLGAAGFQLCTHMRGVPLDVPRFHAIFAEIARRGLAIWLHPIRGPAPDYPTETKSRYEIWWCFGWPYDSSVAMARLVFSGLFDRHPDLKIITHHMGAMIPYFEGRIVQGWGAGDGRAHAAFGCRPVAGTAATSPRGLFQDVLCRHRALRRGRRHAMRARLLRRRQGGVCERLSIRCRGRQLSGARNHQGTGRTGIAEGHSAKDRHRQHLRADPPQLIPRAPLSSASALRASPSPRRRLPRPGPSGRRGSG